MARKSEETISEKLNKVKGADIEKMEDDKTYRSPFLHIEIDDLIPKALDMYSAYEQKNFLAAKGMLVDLADKIGKIKKENVKKSNQEFLFWIDNKIVEGERIQESRDLEEMDNH